MTLAVSRALMSALVCGFMLCAIPSLAGRSVVQPTTISNIANDPVAYDRKRVRLTGKISRMQGIRSFRGDVYVSLTLTDEDEIDSSPTLTVLFWPSRELSVGDIVTVEGRYHVQWRFGGFEHDHFVDASQVKRKGEVEPPPPTSSPRIPI